MIKLFKRVTPLFKLRICWQNIRLSDHFSMKLKYHVPFVEQAGTVYKMTCVKPCLAEYIGESKRPLHQRVLEHGRIPSSDKTITKNTSAIALHIKDCTHYSAELTKKYGMKPSSKEKISFLDNLFTPVATNVNRFYFRKRLEAIAITLDAPILNHQVEHKKVHIISSL